jgi:hypothetical protein
VFRIVSIDSSKIEEGALSWSPWLNFDKPTIVAMPDTKGVYKMHTSMKILYIGSANQSLRQSLLDCLSDPCISKARRFSYAIITEVSSR